MQEETRKYFKRYWSIFVQASAPNYDAPLRVELASPFFLPPGRFEDSAYICFVTGLALHNGNLFMSYGEADLSCRVDCIPWENVQKQLIPVSKFEVITRDGLFVKNLFRRQNVYNGPFPELKGSVTIGAPAIASGDALAPDNWLVLYHTTARENADAIWQNGLLPGRKGNLGGAIYFGESRTSSRAMARVDGVDDNGIVTFEVNVNLGRLKVYRKGHKDTSLTLTQLHKEGFDSATRIHQTGNREYAVYESNRCIILGQVLKTFRHE